MGEKHISRYGRAYILLYIALLEIFKVKNSMSFNQVVLGIIRTYSFL